MIEYFNKKTGKPVKYGDIVTYTKELVSKDGKFTCNSSVECTINNNTLPYLISEGIITQKEVNRDSERIDRLEDRINNIDQTIDEIFDMFERHVKSHIVDVISKKCKKHGEQKG